MEEKTTYWNPYLGGIALGVLLFLSFFIMGNGLGASGSFQRAAAWVMDLVAPAHTQANSYWAHYFDGGKSPFDHWLIFEVLGVVVGGFVSGLLAGRFKIGTDKGPRFSVKKRWIFAFVGGMIMGYGARLARGCTSGQALTGGTVLAAGSWAFMLMVFAGAYATAYFVRKQWI